jgi:hypothetical protein
MGLSGESNNGGVISGTGSALNADVLTSDVTYIENLFVQITGTFVATASFQGSNDNSTWVNVQATDAANVNTAPFSSATAPGLYIVPANFSFFRLRLTAYTSGTVSAAALITENSPLVLVPRTVKSGVLAGDDLTPIGHVTDKLKVVDADVLAILNIIAAGLGTSTASILKTNEAAVTSKSEFDLSGTTYTVPTGKMFSISSFASSYDAQAMLYVRLKKQTGGVGAFVTLFRTTMMSGGQGDSTLSMNFGNGINIGAAGDVFKITIEGSIAKGTIWAEYSGSEI